MPIASLAEDRHRTSAPQWEGRSPLADGVPGRPESVCQPVFPWGGLSLVAGERRQAALQLRITGLTQTATAAKLGVSQATISRDLKRCRQHAIIDGLRDNAAVTIGETVAFYQEVRSLALAEFTQIYLDPKADGPLGTAARLECLRVAVLAERLATELLRDVGLLGARSTPCLSCECLGRGSNPRDPVSVLRCRIGPSASDGSPESDPDAVDATGSRQASTLVVQGKRAPSPPFGTQVAVPRSEAVQTPPSAGRSRLGEGAPPSET
jgi:hypothetical protein